jgi:hypothetical protein
MYVLKGPSDCGNVFCFQKQNLIPEGKFAVVEDGEYANGGWGPSTVDGILYSTAEKVTCALDGMTPNEERIDPVATSFRPVVSI